MRVLALDYGRANTGAAISDPSGTVVRPLEPITAAASDSGIAGLKRLIDDEKAEMVVVGIPVSLSGKHGAQAEETGDFLEALATAVEVPVIGYDERFTSKIAREKGRDSNASEHSVAACCLLEDYLRSTQHASRAGEQGSDGA